MYESLRGIFSSNEKGLDFYVSLVDSCCRESGHVIVSNHRSRAIALLLTSDCFVWFIQPTSGTGTSSTRPSTSRATWTHSVSKFHQSAEDLMGPSGTHH